VCCGDFNAVRGVEERRSIRGDREVTPDVEPFNNFIKENILIDLSLCGCQFTWFKGDGISMSRIDIFLLSEEWCLRWPNYFEDFQIIARFSCLWTRKTGVLVLFEC